VWRGLRRSVLDPVQQLAVQTRDVARGAIDQRIVASGPAEIAALGEDVDTMRARIASELARVEQARIRLIERSEDLARSNADLEQFAYVASHDLSEPLRKVANFCQLLERQYADQLDDKARQYIAYAVDGAKRMQVLIGDLLAFSRVGRTTESFEPVDTEYALDRALAALDERVQDSDAEIVRSPLPVVDGDATLLAALFQNLIGNALKYRNPDRQPRIDVTAEKEESDWVFTVSDNGIGIDRQYAERIFTIFQRLHLRDQYGGTGIGLALCRKIVEFHRGKIWLGESDEPGATFHFTIPEHRDPAETAALDEH
jgi:light-regulated signal transduction histidine kinase (bacteriophytochrome)